MSRLPRFHFVQQRGPWIAQCADPFCMTHLGTDTLPVMRDFGDGQWTWRNPVLFAANPDQFGRAWWNDQGQERWRELLLSGAPVLVRHAIPPTPDAPTGSVGQSIGIFRTSDVEIGEGHMTLKLVERLAEVT
ncbi:hypothetical protein GRZ55_16355 [Chelativorans sp. ZYF759]|uniref:hypothetical protein n=1 Tax=Chelativorans sp. ZYF759 TaxID=2692213 RepID=UPI00145CCC95|nr:hypothetical protein [Chelativorans sp. ZYF759]NMG40820.1 hypothetical protein [Chelativorans sp. ZYF759]